jgi:hypothetical protein
MDNVTFIEIELNDKMVEHAIIDRGNGEFTSMLKSTYEAQQAEQSTPIDTLPSNSADPVEAEKPTK